MVYHMPIYKIIKTSVPKKSSPKNRADLHTWSTIVILRWKDAVRQIEIDPRTECTFPQITVERRQMATRSVPFKHRVLFSVLFEGLFVG